MKFIRGTDSRPFSDELLAYQPLQVLTVAEKVYTVRGVDISYWQGDIDFSLMKSMVDFVIIRYAYGNSTPDANLDKYYKGAVDAGLVVMGYHYLKAGKSWQTHAQTLYNLSKSYPAVYLWGDCEESGGLTKTELDGWFYKYFNNILGLTGASWDAPSIGIYTSPNFWNTYMPRTDWAKALKLWTANWTTGEPLLPYDWSVPNKTYRIHQYSSKGDGDMHGVSSTYIDLDGYNGSVQDFNSEFNTAIPEPEPEEYMKVRSIYDNLRVRNAPVNGIVKDYMMAGNTTEALEEYVTGNDLWIRVGFKQWCAMLVAGKQYLEYVE